MEENRPPEERHEPDAVDTRALSRLGIGFILGGVAALFLIWFVFDYFLKREAAKGPPPSAGIGVQANRLPPEPRLQASPVKDLQQMRAAEDHILNTYSWIDPDKGVVRIPVARAMELLAERGLPARPQSAPQAAGATVPTESGLGPIVQQAGGPLNPNRSFPPPQPLEIRGSGSFGDGRQAGGPPTPPDRSLENLPQGQPK